MVLGDQYNFGTVWAGHASKKNCKYKDSEAETSFLRKKEKSDISQEASIRVLVLLSSWLQGLALEFHETLFKSPPTFCSLQPDW